LLGTAPQPGAEPCVDQLKSIYASLDSACRIALDLHSSAASVALLPSPKFAVQVRLFDPQSGGQS